MPNCGGNDGSLVLPLSSCDYQDFRPSIQAAYYLTHREVYFGNGPWNEMVERLFRDEPGLCTAAHREIGRLESDSRSSQYIKLEARESYCLLRAARYRDRPAQADQLHVDLWWRGENIACDAGTYLYNGADPWSNALARTSVHNTVSIANHDQMTRAGRFLWLDWAQANSVCYQVDSRGMAIEAEHDGYRSLGITHRRTVLSLHDLDAYVVVDDLLGNFSGRLRLHWLFPKYPFFWNENASTLVLQTSAGEFKCMISSSQGSAISIATAGEVVAGPRTGQKKTDLVRGWRSLYYGEKEAALSLAVETESGLPARFVSVLAPAELVTTANELGLTFRSNGTDQRIALRGSGNDRIFSV
jgi:asparagine synthase (glutamine-hydrolysing)